MSELDGFDTRLLVLLQDDAGLTNQQLGDRIGLSASQVSRRRQRLEQAGVIRRYRADIDPLATGFSVVAYVGVALQAHSRQNASRFRDLVRMLPEVQEAHALTGDVDYMLKVVVADMQSFDHFYKRLIKNMPMGDVTSSFAMEQIKYTTALPLSGI